MEKNLLKACIKTIDDKIGEDIRVFELNEVNPYVDYFVIASSNNSRKANAICEALYDMADEMGIDYVHSNADKESKWFLCDLGSVVCHIFVDDERRKYNLEGLWKDLEIKY